MVPQFVRYSSDVERPDPNFDQALQIAIEDVKQYIARSVEVAGVTHAVRDVHAKGYGLARGEVEILGGVPAEYAQGIYAKPGRHEAMVRFSNGSHQLAPELLLDNVVGMGLKIFGIEGPTLLEDEPDSGTFDYAMINNPVFFVNSLDHYVFIHQLLLYGAKPPAGESAGDARARMSRFLHDFLTGKGHLPPEEWAWDELGVFLSLSRIRAINALLSTYWTTGAMRHGDYIAKVRVKPAQASADRVERRVLDPACASDLFRPALVAELKERPYEFEIQAQLCADLYHMPIERLTVPWPETLSPFVTIAKLRLPQQDIGGDDNLERMDATSMTPWRVTHAHRPLGNIQRARKEVYRQSSLLRHQLNRQERREPRNLAEVFG